MLFYFQLLLLLLSIFFSTIKTHGFIQSWDYTVDYTNSGYMSKLSFGFALDNGISSSDFLKLTFPFDLHASLIGNVPQGIKINLNLIGSSGCLPIQSTNTNVFILGSSETGTYYIQFLDEKGNANKPLLKNTWYLLEITLSKSISLSAGIYEPIKIATISAISPNGIIYDYNNIFQTIEITETPKIGILKLNYLMDNPNKNDINFIHSVLYDVTPQIDILNEGRIMILMKNNDWSFNGKTCISLETYKSQTKVDGSTETITIPALNALQYSCTVDSSSNIIIITFNQTIQKETLYRFQISIRNPNHVSSSGAFETRTLLKYSNQIIELSETTTTFSVNPFNWGTSNINLKVFLGWGVDLAQSNLPENFVFIRGDASTPKYKFYNAIKFSFRPSYETVPGIKLKLVLKLNEEVGFEVLKGSISENLPPFGSYPVNCVLDSTPTTNKIECTNVGVLSNISDYHIGLKAFFPNSASTSLDAEFGKISIYTYNSKIGDYDSNLLLPSARSLAASYTSKNNLYLLPATFSNINDYFAIHSNFGTSIAAIDSTNYGLKQDLKKTQNLIFTFTGSEGSFDGSAFDTNAGFSIFTTNQIVEKSVFDATDADKDGNAQVAQDVGGITLFSRVGHDDTIGRKWTWVKVYADSVALLKGSIADDGTSTKTFGVKDFEIKSMSSNYADSYCFDFYGVTYNKIKIATPVKVAYFAINSFVFSDEKLGNGKDAGNLKIGISNFWTGTSGNGRVDGAIFPAFIRIIGYLTPSQLISVNRLAIFFDNLNYFSSSKYLSSIDVVDCSSSLSSKTSCYGYPGNPNFPHTHSLPRIEIDVDLLISGTSIASPFQILIPVQTIEASKALKIFFATMTTNYQYGVSKPYFNIFQTLQTFYSNPSYPFMPVAGAMVTSSNLGGLDYFLRLTTNPTPQVGQTAVNSPALIYTAHVDIDTANPQVNPNDESVNFLVGAGFTYISEYNMIDNGFYVESDWVDDSTNSRRCLSFRYTISNVAKYGFFCPFAKGSISTSTNLRAFNFIYPYLNGINLIDNTYGVWSDKTGLMKGFAKHTSASDKFQESLIETVGVGVSPNLKKNRKNQQLIWGLKVYAPIPIDGQIKIIFTSNLNFNPDITGKCYIKAFLLANERKHNCVITKGANFIKFTLTAATSDLSFFPAGQYSIYQYNIEKDNVNGLDITFTFETYTSANILIGKSSTGAGTLKFDNAALPPSIIIKQLYFNSWTKGARDSFFITFYLDKVIFYNELFLLDFGSLEALDNVNDVLCWVKESDGVSFDWLKIEMLDMRNVKLTPKKDILISAKEYTFECNFLNVPYSSDTPISISLKSDANILTVSINFNLPTFSESLNGVVPQENVTFIKNYNNFGLYSHFTFNFTLGKDINLADSISISFPKYYNIWGFSYCFIDGSPVFCYFPRDQIMLVQGFNKQISAGTYFSLKIIGVMQAKILQGQEKKLVIGLNMTNNEKVNTYTIALNDVYTNTNQIKHLNVYQFQMLNSFIRERNTLIFYIDSPAEEIIGDSYLLLDFNDDLLYKNLLEKEKNYITSSLTLVSGGNSIISSTEIIGLRIKMKLSGNLQKSDKYKLIISNIPNPENPICKFKLYSLAFADTLEKTVSYKTTASTSNFPGLSFVTNPSLLMTDWKDFNSNLIQHNKNLIEVVIGTFSPIIFLFPRDKDFNKPIGVQLQTMYNPIKLLNASLSANIKIGDQYFAFRVGCPNTMVQQVVDIKIERLEKKGGTVADLEYLSLSFLNKTLPIQPPYTTYKICNLCKSLPITFDFSSSPPFTYLTLRFEITYPGFNLNYTFEQNDKTSIDFTITPTSSFISFRISSKTPISIGDSDIYAILTIKMMNGEVNNFRPTNEIIKIAPRNTPNGAPNLIVSYKILSELQNQQTLKFFSSQTILVYCAMNLFFNEASIREWEFAYGKVREGYLMGEKDRYDEQFLSFGMENENTSYSFNITRLKAKKKYRFRCWAENQLGITSEVKEGTFTTLDNGGKLLRFGLTFKGAVTNYHKERVSCFICSYFAIPCKNIQSFDNIYCKSDTYESSRLLQNSSSFLNPTNTVNTTNSTSSNTTSNNQTLPSNSTNTTNTTINTTNVTFVYTDINFYLLPNLDISSDDSSLKMSVVLQTSEFKSYFMGNLTDLPNITYFHPLSEVAQIEPEYDLSERLNVTVGADWVYVANFRMKSRGFVVFIIEPNIDYRNSSLNGTTNSTNASSIISNNSSSNNSNSSMNNSIELPSNSDGFFDYFVNVTNNKTTYTYGDEASNSTKTAVNFTEIAIFYKPLAQQIKLGLNYFNNASFMKAVLLYNYTDANINITSLKNLTEYRIYYTLSSEDPSIYSLINPEVRFLTAKTLDYVRQSSFSEMLKLNLTVLIILITFLSMY